MSPFSFVFRFGVAVTRGGSLSSIVLAKSMKRKDTPETRYGPAPQCMRQSRTRVAPVWDSDLASTRFATFDESTTYPEQLVCIPYTNSNSRAQRIRRL